MKKALFIGILLILLFAIFWLSNKRLPEVREYNLDQSDQMLFVDSWKPVLDGKFEYGVASRAVALRSHKDSKLSWVMYADKYPDSYLSSSGFFYDLGISGENLWILVGDRTSINQVAIVDLATKKLIQNYKLPDNASILVAAINRKLLRVVISIKQVNMNNLVLYNLVTGESVVLDSVSTHPSDDSFATPWPSINWVDTTTLEYVTKDGVAKKYTVER